jgi:flavin reductase (DIM6/NTAB) family NADH-FMN oxidoreductase RutF
MGWADAPLIDGCAAWFECLHHAQHRAGDHRIFIGVVATCERASGDGLVFHQGRFGSVVPVPER